MKITNSRFNLGITSQKPLLEQMRKNLSSLMKMRKQRKTSRSLKMRVQVIKRVQKTKKILTLIVKVVLHLKARIYSIKSQRSKQGRSETSLAFLKRLQSLRV